MKLDQLIAQVDVIASPKQWMRLATKVRRPAFNTVWMEQVRACAPGELSPLMVWMYACSPVSVTMLRTCAAST